MPESGFDVILHLSLILYVWIYEYANQSILLSSLPACSRSISSPSTVLKHSETSLHHAVVSNNIKEIPP